MWYAFGIVLFVGLFEIRKLRLERPKAKLLYSLSIFNNVQPRIVLGGTNVWSDWIVFG
jgi:hypothetical protein